MPDGLIACDIDKVNDENGMHANPSTVSCVISLIGTEVYVETTEKEKFIGLLNACSPKFDIGLVYARKCPVSDNDNICLTQKNAAKKMVFNSSSVVSITGTMENIDKERSFRTDGEISQAKNGNIIDDDNGLQEWVADSDDDKDDSAFTSSTAQKSGAKGGKGWSVDEMFGANEHLGVKSSFVSDLSQYTTVEACGDEEARRKADRIAQSIEKDALSRRNADLENDDEERDLDKMNFVNVRNSNNTKYDSKASNPRDKRRSADQANNWRSNTVSANATLNRARAIPGNSTSSTGSGGGSHHRSSLPPNHNSSVLTGGNSQRIMPPIPQSLESNSNNSSNANSSHNNISRASLPARPPPQPLAKSFVPPSNNSHTATPSPSAGASNFSPPPPSTSSPPSQPTGQPAQTTKVSGGTPAATVSSATTATFHQQPTSNVATSTTQSPNGGDSDSAPTTASDVPTSTTLLIATVTKSTALSSSSSSTTTTSSSKFKFNPDAMPFVPKKELSVVSPSVTPGNGGTVNAPVMVMGGSGVTAQISGANNVMPQPMPMQIFPVGLQAIPPPPTVYNPMVNFWRCSTPGNANTSMQQQPTIVAAKPSMIMQNQQFQQQPQQLQGQPAGGSSVSQRGAVQQIPPQPQMQYAQQPPIYASMAPGTIQFAAAPSSAAEQQRQVMQQQQISAQQQQQTLQQQQHHVAMQYNPQGTPQQQQVYTATPVQFAPGVGGYEFSGGYVYNQAGVTANMRTAGGGAEVDQQQAAQQPPPSHGQPQQQQYGTPTPTSAMAAPFSYVINGNVMSNGMPVAATGVSPFQTIPSGNGQVPQRSQNVAPHDSNSMTTVTSANPGFPPPGFAGPPFITQTSFQPIIQIPASYAQQIPFIYQGAQQPQHQPQPQRQ